MKICQRKQVWKEQCDSLDVPITCFSSCQQYFRQISDFILFLNRKFNAFLTF
jgi:hypothetical protein